MIVYLLIARRLGAFEAPMRLSGGSLWLLRVSVSVRLTFIYVPLIVIALYAFNGSTTLTWPLVEPDHAVVRRGAQGPDSARRASTPRSR